MTGVLLMGKALAACNASLNATCALLLLLGLRAIRAGRRRRHRALMVAAFVCSAVFLVSYLVRLALTGTHRFPDLGWLRVVYLVILATHTSLAVLLVPMVLRTFYLALRERFNAHRRLAPWTWGVWLYVSVTGVVVYALLYHVAPNLGHSS